MSQVTRDAAWGPIEVHVAAARDAASALQGAGFPIELHEPNLPVYAPEGEGKRLARKHKEENPTYEWRGDPYLLLGERARLLDALRFFRDELGYEMLIDLTAVDFDADEPHLWAVYQLLSLGRRARVTLKLEVPKEDPRLASASGIYPAAEWHEREAAEMFGIVYEGHPDPRHMLLPDDWEGHPLRKDYVYPEEYHGISCL